MSTYVSKTGRPRAWCYKIHPDHSDPDPMVLREWDPRGISEYALPSDSPMEHWPEDVTFFATGAHHEDYLFPAVVSWIIVSETVRKALVACGITDFQLLPVRVIHKESGKDLGPHWVMHPLQVIEALDVDHTHWLTALKDKNKHALMDIWQEAFREESIRDIDIFYLRVNEDMDVRIYVSERVKSCLEHVRVTGFKFLPVPVY